MDQRKQLRAQIIERRAQIPQDARLAKSSLICQELNCLLDQKLVETGFFIDPLNSPAAANTDPEDSTNAGASAPSTDSPIVAVFSAFPEEVQLDEFIRETYEKGLQIAFPCMIKDAWGLENCCQQKMEMRLVSQKQYLDNSVEFLLHPLRSYHHDSEDIQNYPYVSADNLTMIVCPLVGFDDKGNRIGYGGGNYDRYLTQMSDSALIIGAAFAEQKVDAVPTDHHDIPISVLYR